VLSITLNAMLTAEIDGTGIALGVNASPLRVRLVLVVSVRLLYTI
jgi:hypothetical protein